MTEIDQYIDQLPDKRSENEVVKLLKGVGEEKAYNLIVEKIDESNNIQLKSILNIAKRCLSKKEYLLSILDIGLKKKDVSEIGIWLEAVIPVVGAKAVVKYLLGYLETDPGAVILSWYKLSGIIHAKYKEAQPLLDQLKANINSIDNMLEQEYLDYWNNVK